MDANDDSSFNLSGSNVVSWSNKAGSSYTFDQLSGTPTRVNGPNSKKAGSTSMEVLNYGRILPLLTAITRWFRFPDNQAGPMVDLSPVRISTGYLAIIVVEITNSISMAGLIMVAVLQIPIGISMLPRKTTRILATLGKTSFKLNLAVVALTTVLGGPANSQLVHGETSKKLLKVNLLNFWYLRKF